MGQGQDVGARLRRVEEKLDRVLALLERGIPAVAAEPRPGAGVGQARTSATVGPDELHMWRCTFSALHGARLFPELLRDWFATHPGRFTPKAVLAELARTNPETRTIFPVRLASFLRAHHAWLGIVREKEKGVTVWRRARG